MMLIEETQVPEGALPVQEFKDHLRLATGFADAGSSDGYLAGLLRAAIAAVEGRTGKALVARDFRLTLRGWRDGEAEALPVAPVTAVAEVRTVDAGGLTTVASPGRYALEPDSQRPLLKARSYHLPTIPVGGSAEIRFTAGFGSVWTDVPADLRQAVLMLAAGYFERRHEEGAEPGAMPFGVMALIERWRGVRGFAAGRTGARR